MPGIMSLDIWTMDEERNASAPFPKLFHQIWLNYSKISRRWERAIEHSRDLNKDYRYRLWGARHIEQFFGRKYPWFLETYRSYPNDIQRADAARYFILLHYGGVYIDMDVESKVSFNHIVSAKNKTGLLRDCILAPANPEGVSPDLVFCTPQSRFLKYVTLQLTSANRRYIFPYLTVMLSTGPFFFTRCYHKYPYKEDVVVLSQDEFQNRYFLHVHGRTWYDWDARFIYKVSVFVSTHLLDLAFVVVCFFIFSFLGVAVFNRRRYFF